MRDKKNINLILPYIPSKQHQRLVIQQGAFLVPTNIEIGFEESIKKGYETKKTKENIIKFVMPNNRSMRLNILNDLNLMNINSATLFPGLDGFARSLRLTTDEQVDNYERIIGKKNRYKIYLTTFWLINSNFTNSLIYFYQFSPVIILQYC